MYFIELLNKYKQNNEKFLKDIANIALRPGVHIFNEKLYILLYFL